MRILTSQALTALDAGRFIKRNLVLVEMPTERVGIWDDAYSVSYGGDTYGGAAGRFTISAYSSAFDGGARNVDVTLSGLDTEIATRIEGQPYHQRPITCMLAIMAVDAPQIIHVSTWFTGFIDQLVRKEKGGGASTITLKCEGIAREMQRSGGRTRSDADQRLIDPTDGFLKHTANAVSTEIRWGQSVTQEQGETRRRKFLGIF